MSGTEMAKAATNYAYRAVDGTGRNAIYVYMTYNGQDGYQSWKISGGLNGGFLIGVIVGIAIVFAALAMFFIGGALSLIFLLVAALYLVYWYSNIKYQSEDPAILGCFTNGFALGSAGAILAAEPSKLSYIIFGLTNVFTIEQSIDCVI